MAEQKRQNTTFASYPPPCSLPRDKCTSDKNHKWKKNACTKAAIECALALLLTEIGNKDAVKFVKLHDA